MNKNRYALRKLLSAKQNAITALPGILGDFGGNVSVPGRLGYVYVRISGQPPVQVYNKVAPTNQAALPVLVGYDPLEPTLFQVLAVRSQYLEQQGVSMANAAQHGGTHGWFGRDPVYVALRQFLPGRITPAGGLTFSVHRFTAYFDGVLQLVAPADPISIASLQPYLGSGMGVFVLVSVNSDGEIVTTKGTEGDVSTLSIASIPAAPSDTAYLLGAIRLYDGQTKIDESRLNTDIVDLRWPQVSSSSSSPSSISPLTADVDADGYGITNLKAPTNDQDAATKAYVDSAAGGSSGHTILDESTALPTRSKLNFTGDNVVATDDEANDQTNVAISIGLVNEEIIIRSWMGI